MGKEAILEKVIQAQREIIQGYYLRLASHHEPTIRVEHMLAWLQDDMETIRMENLNLDAMQILSQSVKGEREQLIEALGLLLKSPENGSGCPMCDNGKLRNPNKQHWDDCEWNNAQLLYNRLANR